MAKQKIVLVAFADLDAGMMPFDIAKVEGQLIADKSGSPVYLRDPITDRVVRVIAPRSIADDDRLDDQEDERGDYR